MASSGILLASWPTFWVALFGVLGGALNAALTADLRLGWSRIASAEGARPLARPGLLVNLAAGALAAVAVYAGVASALCRTLPPRLEVAPLPLAAASLFVGLATARWLTNELDKRLLRAAVCQASAAPAAHPDTIALLRSAAPPLVYVTASSLMPRHRPREARHH